MLFQDCPVCLGIESGADVADHVTGGVARRGIQDFGVCRVRQIVQKPHGVAVQQFVHGGAVDVGSPFQLRCMKNDRTRIGAALGPESPDFFIDQHLHRHQIGKGAADSTLFRHRGVGSPRTEVDFGKGRPWHLYQGEQHNQQS